MFVSILFHKEELCTSSRQNPFIKGCPPPGRHGQTLAWTAANAAAACIWNIASQITWKISPQNCKSEQGHSFAPQNVLLCNCGGTCNSWTSSPSANAWRNEISKWNETVFGLLTRPIAEARGRSWKTFYQGWKLSQESKWPAMLTKTAKQIFIFSWMGSSGGKTSWMTASRQGRKCFVSAAFASKTGKFLCGLLGSQIIDNLKFVNLEATWFWT